MEIINETPFQFALIPGRIEFPDHSLTLIIKATYDLNQDQSVTLSEEQIFPTGDEYYPDDEDMAGSIRYSSDFAYFKPNTDILLVGKCCSPKGTSSVSRQVTLTIGELSKSLIVLGNRHRKLGFTGFKPSNPEPFEEIDIRYEKSYGGKGFKKNPVGTGRKKLTLESGKTIRPIPNIVNPGDTLFSVFKNPDPAGFGPISPEWVQRKSKIGTYKGKYLQERWPWFPADFNWEYYNAAPEDQQIQGYLKGDETLSIENMHPLHEEYTTQLPGLNIRCFLHDSQIDNGNKTIELLREVKMNMDTLWVDMENGKLILVWRGATTVLSEEYEEIKHAYIVQEPIDNPNTLSPNHYNEIFHRRIKELTQDETDEIKPVDGDQEDGETKIDGDTELQDTKKNMDAALKKAGIDKNKIPPPDKKAKEREAFILKSFGIDNNIEPEPVLTRESLIKRVSKGESFKGVDLTGLNLSGLDLSHADFQQALLKGVSFAQSDLTKAILSQADLSQCDLTGACLKEAVLNDTDLTDAILTDSDLTKASIIYTVFEKTKFNNAVLNEINGPHSNFSESDLTGAKIRNSLLCNSDFSNTLLNDADFQGSNLMDASFGGAKGAKINMNETDLTQVRASGGCDFSKGVFTNSKAKESIWEDANLQGSNFSFAQMEGANFNSANLALASLNAADLKFSKFVKADLSKAKLQAADVFMGSFEKADLTNTDLCGSNLYGVEFLDSTIDQTKFEFANLKMTKLADYKQE